MSILISVVATPLGNLGDITLRALEILNEADVIICEDTRVTRKLLSFHEIHGKELISLKEHSENKLNRLIEHIQDKKAALVTDSGTPGISDPGTRLIRHLQNFELRTSNFELRTSNFELRITPIPGASALTTIISVSGLGAGGFVFLGFLPRSRRKIVREIEKALNAKSTIIFYESPYRIMATLEILSLHWPSCELVLGRELTKQYEEILRGQPQAIIRELARKDKILGEFTVAMAENSDR